MNEVSEILELSPPATSGPRIWATKGPEFWALLSAILLHTKPETILELGGGRSTTFLADYAWRNKKRMVTFEQSEEWYRKISEDLRCMGITREIAYHLPLDETSIPPSRPFWYDYTRARRLIGRAVWDLVFLDGPQRNARRNPRGQELIAKAAREARLIIVDDVHRDYNMTQFMELARRFPPDGLFFYGYSRNRLGIAAGEWAPIVRSCFEFLAIPYSQDATAVVDVNAGDDDEQ